MILLWSESPSTKCAKLHTVAATNNRNLATRSLYCCLFAPHTSVLFFMNILFMVNRTFNATSIKRLHQHPFLFTMNRTGRTFFLWRLHLAWPSHHGHSTSLLRMESPSGRCTKLHTVVAGNKRSPDEITLLLLVWVTYMSIWMIFFTHIPFMVNYTFNTIVSREVATIHSD